MREYLVLRLCAHSLVQEGKGHNWMVSAEEHYWNNPSQYPPSPSRSLPILISRTFAVLWSKLCSREMEARWEGEENLHSSSQQTYDTSANSQGLCRCPSFINVFNKPTLGPRGLRQNLVLVITSCNTALQVSPISSLFLWWPHSILLIQKPVSFPHRVKSSSPNLLKKPRTVGFHSNEERLVQAFWVVTFFSTARLNQRRLKVKSSSH